MFIKILSIVHQTEPTGHHFSVSPGHMEDTLFSGLLLTLRHSPVGTSDNHPWRPLREPLGTPRLMRWMSALVRSEPPGRLEKKGRKIGDPNQK